MKSSTKWFIAILCIIIIIGFGSMLFLYLIFIQPNDENVEYVSGAGEKIAVIELKGVIVESENIVKQFKKYQKDK